MFLECRCVSPSVVFSLLCRRLVACFHFCVRILVADVFGCEGEFMHKAFENLCMFRGDRLGWESFQPPCGSWFFSRESFFWVRS